MTAREVPGGFRTPVMELENRCPTCGRTRVCRYLVTRRKWQRWNEVRRLARPAAFWRELPAEDAEEFFGSGLCPECQRTLAAAGG